MASPQQSAKIGAPREYDSDEEVSVGERMDRVAEEKRQALLDPGPPWKEWFLYSGAKWWVGLGFLIVDVWILVTWIELGAAILFGPLLVVSLYLEVLLYRYLWYRPSEPSRNFHASWFTPVRYGRWTPEGGQLRAGASLTDVEEGPNPHEFL